MGEIKMVAEFFCMSLALGVGIYTPLASTKLTGVGFFNLAQTICLVSLIVGLGLHLSYASISAPQSIAGFVALIAMSLARALHKDKKSIFMWILYFVQNLALLWLMLRMMNGYIGHYAYALSSALFLGIITYAMILGHYYLVVPKLTVRPLIKSVIILWVLLFLKMISSCDQLYHNWGFFTEGTRLGAGFSFNWLILSMRWLWGYVVIGVMSYFVWRLVRMRSTQSATGIFYAMTFFVLVGELTAAFFFLKYGLTL